MGRTPVGPLLVVLLMAAAVAAYSGGYFGGTRSSSSTVDETTPATASSYTAVYTTHVISFSTVDTTVDLSLRCTSRDGLPDPACTPGAIDPNVTQANINTTICVSGYTASVRPPTSYTSPRKVQSIQEYGYADTNTSDYEYDHLISLELGGGPTDTRNLWAEPHYGNYTSFDKDGFENYLRRQVCAGAMSLAAAQSEISTDWASYWVAAGRP